jgi:Na+/proline symporter
MPTTLQLADHIVIIGYFALLTMVGAYFWKRMRHTQDFFSGGNKILWWLAGISF